MGIPGVIMVNGHATLSLKLIQAFLNRVLTTR